MPSRVLDPSGPGGLHMSEQSGLVIRAALQEYLRDARSDENLRHGLRRFVADARAHRMAAEQVVTEFRYLWGTLPEVQQLEPDRRDDLRARLITQCIRDYYGDAERPV